MGRTVTDMGYSQKAHAERAGRSSSILKKHVATIHCSNTLSLLQRKISNALLHNAYHQLPTQEVHSISINQLCRLIGYSGNNHDAIKTALKGLISTVLEWNIIDEQTGSETWSASSIISDVQICGPECTYSYSRLMREWIYSPSVYGNINMVIQSKFHSNYGLALYENCVRYKGLPMTKWFEVATFRKLMGVKEGHYLIFRDFKKRVIDKAVDEVNMYSDIIVSPDLHRVGRKVTKLRFHLKHRPKKVRIAFHEEGESPVVDKDEVKVPDLIIAQLKTFGFTQQQLILLFQQYTLVYVQQKIELLEHSSSFQKGKIQDIASYLMKALREDFQPSISSENIVRKKAQERERKQAMEQQQLKQEEAKKRRYDEYKRAVIQEYFDALSEEGKEKIQASYVEYLQARNLTLLINWYERCGMEHAAVKKSFFTFIEENYSEQVREFHSSYKY